VKIFIFIIKGQKIKVQVGLILIYSSICIDQITNSLIQFVNLKESPKATPQKFVTTSDLADLKNEIFGFIRTLKTEMTPMKPPGKIDIKEEKTDSCGHLTSINPLIIYLLFVLSLIFQTLVATNALLQL
jgi:hypothetical protein